MQDYVTGVLEENEVTEVYHGVPFARLLTIRTMHGATFHIHDPIAAANDLKTGRNYNFVVAVSGVEKVRAFTTSTTQTARFSGTIRQLKWEPTIDQLIACNADLLNHPMSIIGTINGHVLISRLLLGGVGVGNAITWGKDRFDLVGVYK